MIDQERITPSRILDGNPDRSVVQEPVGELSLPGVPGCLSLHRSILAQPSKSGNVQAQPGYFSFPCLRPEDSEIGGYIEHTTKLANCLSSTPSWPGI
jgi:hypothetical protein